MGTLKRMPLAGFQTATPELHVYTRRVFRPRLFGMNAHYWQKHPLEIGWQCTEYFVDKPRVMRAMLRAKKAPQMKAAAYIRRTARRLMPYRKKSSAPGFPPHAHKREPNLRTIFFAWDVLTDNVVVGPVLFRRAKDGGGKVPRLHEKGGTKTFRRKAGYYGGIKFPKQKIAVPYPARPFMLPALKMEAPKFPGLWENSVKP